jgi:hypothetical protein
VNAGRLAPLSRTGALAVAALLDAFVLVAMSPDPALLIHLRHPRAWLAAAGSDAASAELAGAALWLVAVWLGLGLSTCVAATLPGVAGRGARRLARLVLPTCVYRLAAGAAGLGVLLVSAQAHAGPPRRPAVTTAVALPAPTWPGDAPLPSPRWPTAPATPTPVPVPHPADAHRQPGSVRAPARHASTVRVVPGDSLWRIAAAHLPGRASNRAVAAAWPRWYAANRQVIGADPDHITPGQVLVAPHSVEEESR